MSDGMYRAAFIALYERSRMILPEVERSWCSEEAEEWCRLVRDLMRAEGTPKTGTSSVRKGACAAKTMGVKG